MLSATGTPVTSLTKKDCPYESSILISSLSLGCWCQALHARRLTPRIWATSDITQLLLCSSDKVCLPPWTWAVRHPGVLARLMGKRQCLVASFHPLLPLHISSFHPRIRCPHCGPQWEKQPNYSWVLDTQSVGLKKPFSFFTWRAPAASTGWSTVKKS